MQRGSGEGTKRALIDAAAELFAERGFASVTVQEVVERARVTKGAFYHHFKSKEDVLVELFDLFALDHIERMSEIESAGLPAVATIAAFMQESAENVEKYRRYCAAIVGELRVLHEERLDASSMQHLAEGVETIVTFWTSALERGVRSGELRPIDDVRSMAFGLLSMPVFTFAWFEASKPFDGAAAGRTFAEVVLHGLAAPAPTVKRTRGRLSARA